MGTEMGMIYVLSHLTHVLDMTAAFLPESYPAAERTPQIIEEAAMTALKKTHSNSWSLFDLVRSLEPQLPAGFDKWDPAYAPADLEIPWTEHEAAADLEIPWTEHEAATTAPKKSSGPKM